MSTESKTLRFEVKALGVSTDADGQEFGQIEALGAVFNNVDEDDDSIYPGAFTRTIKNSKERAIARKKRYLAPMLWQHDTHEIIGGWYDLSETQDGLLGKGDISLATQRGREYYALAKAGMTDQFSIIYDVPAGGAKYKNGVRELHELRLFSIDPVTFAANDATALMRVKASKASDGGTVVCGNTKGPIGPRDESWDGAQAEREIWAVAYDEDSGEVKASVAKKYFMTCSGDGSKKGDYGYPFWFVGSSPHISVGAVKAIAAAIQGARGASAPDGLKAKVETLYRRINAKYPDAPQLTPPWQSDTTKESRSSMHTKSFEEHYSEQQCADLLRDWQDVVLTAFTCAVYDAFQIGDQPESDVNDALTALKGAVMEWVDEAVKYGLSDYLDAQGYDGGTEYRMRQGGSTSYGWMSRATPLQRKAMTAGDATTGGFAEKADTLRGAAEDATNAVEKHVKALHDTAAQMKALVNGAAPVTPAKAAQIKAGRAFSAAHEKALTEHADGLDSAADTLQHNMTRHMKAVTTVADDLATVLQGSEAAYGADHGTPTDGQQQGKQRQKRAPSPSETRAPRTPPSSRDTVREEDVSLALSTLRSLRTSA